MRPAGNQPLGADRPQRGRAHLALAARDDPRFCAHGADSGAVSSPGAQPGRRGACPPPSASVWTFVKSMLVADSELNVLAHGGDTVSLATPPHPGGHRAGTREVSPPPSRPRQGLDLARSRLAGGVVLAAEGKANLLIPITWLL